MRAAIEWVILVLAFAFGAYMAFCIHDAHSNPTKQTSTYCNCTTKEVWA